MIVTDSILLLLCTIFLFNAMDAVAKTLLQTYPINQVIVSVYGSDFVIHSSPKHTVSPKCDT